MPDPCCVCQQPDSIPACYWAKCPIWIMNCITSIFATTCFVKFALSLLLQSFGVEHTCLWDVLLWKVVLYQEQVSFVLVLVFICSRPVTTFKKRILLLVYLVLLYIILMLNLFWPKWNVVNDWNERLKRYHKAFCFSLFLSTSPNSFSFPFPNMISFFSKCFV